MGMSKFLRSAVGKYNEYEKKERARRAVLKEQKLAQRIEEQKFREETKRLATEARREAQRKTSIEQARRAVYNPNFFGFAPSSTGMRRVAKNMGYKIAVPTSNIKPYFKTRKVRVHRRKRKKK